MVSQATATTCPQGKAAYTQTNGNGNDNGETPPPTGDTGETVANKFIFFYHPDHLGSSSYISDQNGEVSQHLEYFAFGETFIEEHSNTSYTPYKFNGKELDEETGLYYYGARYYDPSTSVWISVDPLAEKYPSMSPYTYCANNPINIIDPDGRYLFGLFGSTSAQRRQARAETFAAKVGGEVVTNGNKVAVNYDRTGSEEGGMSFKSNDNFGDFSTWDNFKATLKGFDSALEGSSDGCNTGGTYGGAKGLEELGKDATSLSTYVKAAGVAGAALGTVTADPPLAAGGVALYNIGDGLDKAGTALQVASDLNKGNYGDAANKLGGQVINQVIGSKIDKSITGDANKVFLKYTADKILD